MAKTVQPIAIELGIKGGEKLAALNKSFRDLSKQVKLSDADITQATKDIVTFATKAGNSEATIKGQIKAFEGLREQAALGGKAYIQLGKDIESLKVTLRGSTDEMEQQRAAFVKTGNAAKSSASDIAGVISQLENLRNKARPGSSAFAQLGKDIAALKSQLQEANVEVKKFNAGFEISQRPAMSLEKIQRQIGKLAEGLKSLNFISDEFLNVQERIALLGQVQGRTTARQQVRAQAQMYSSAAFANFVEGPAGKLSLPNTTAALQLEVSELQQKLVNLDRSSSDYTATAMKLADAQRKLAQDVMGLSSAYDKLGAAEAGAARRAGKVAGIQQYYAGGAGAPGVAGFRDPATGAIIARGAGNVADRRAFLAAQREAGLSQYSAPISPELPEAIRKANEERKQEIRSRIENLRKINKENEALREQAAINRSIARGRARSIAQVAAEPPVREISGLYRQIGDIGMSKITASIEMMGQSYSTVATDIKKATAASNGSIASLNNQRSAWSSLRDQLNPASKQFRDVTKELERVDRALSKVQRRRGLSPMQMTQAAGAAISGGIFGGPEGFLGGVGGALVGGVGGAFAGAAFGAQVGMIRQQIGQYTKMAAEIDRLRLGLAGASNDFSEFVQATQATEQASQRLLIPLADSYRIMTQLRANTVELGISVEDTRKIFEGITASVYKTGGGLAEVQGAMRAVIQVLSKGSPQAEELRGQLGERLPAAIVDFAKFTKRTPEELADAFQQSKVTLQEFVDFAKNKFDENGEYLNELASNAAYAGLRYEKALEKLQLTTGRVFQATGAALQDYATTWLTAIDDILNKSVQLGLIKPGPNFLANQALQEKEGLEKLKNQLAEAEKEYIKAAVRFAQLDPFTKKAFGEGVYKRYEGEIANLKEAIKIIETLERQTKERQEQLEEDRLAEEQKQRGQSLLNAIEQRENAIAQARIQLEEQAASIRKQAIEQARQLEERFANQRLQKERELQDLRRQLAYVEEDVALTVAESQFIAGGVDPEIVRIRREGVEFERKQKEEEIELERQFLDEQTETSKAIEEFKSSNAKAIIEANEQHTKRMGKIQTEYAKNVAKIVEEGTDRAGKRLEIASRLAAYYMDRASINYQRANLGQPVIPTAAGINEQTNEPIYNGFFPLGVPESIKDIDRQIAKAATELYQLPTATAVAAPAIDKISMNFDGFTSSLEKNAAAFDRQNEKIKKLKQEFTGNAEIRRLVSAAAGVSTGVAGQRQQLERDQTISRGALRLREEGYSQGTARSLMEQELGAAQRLAQIQALREEAEKAAGSQEELAKVGAAFDTITQNVQSSANAVRDLTIVLDNIPTEIKLRTAVVDAKQELRDLVDTSNQVNGAATAIGDAFAQSFTSAISGASTAKEALASFFQSVGSYFLDMANQIIAKMITMAILNTVARVLPGLGSNAGSGFNLTGFGNLQSDAGSGISGFMAGAGGILGRASGGPVNANQPYIVGERGPELFVPQQSGAVVNNNQLSSAMNRYRRSGTTATNESAAAMQGGEGGTAVLDKPIDVRYTVERINNVEYVTADQFQAGMREAAKQGAAQGERRTIQKLQMSPGARRRLGL
jgi:tape measure domain-containing protein